MPVHGNDVRIQWGSGEVRYRGGGRDSLACCPTIEAIVEELVAQEMPGHVGWRYGVEEVF